MPGPLITADQLLDLYEPGHPTELVRGELRSLSPSGYLHGAVTARLATLVGLHVRDRRLGEAFGAETGFLLARNPDTVRAPDVAFVRKERLPREFSTGYFPGPPDLAAEVTSPTDTNSKVREKALSWLQHGTRLVWVIDPVSKSATVYRSRDDVRVIEADGDLTGDDVLPGFTVALRELFPAGSGPTA